MHPPDKRSRGFTIIELLATIIAIVLILAVLVTILPRWQGHCGSRQLKCAAQVHAIMQALLIVSIANRDEFVLPSRIDTKNSTVVEQGRAKDTTANILSFFIWNGALSPEVCVSPAEANPSIIIDERYEHAAPRAAVDPANSLWDPAFSADFTNGRKGNLSYAMLETSGDMTSGRRALWRNLLDPTLPTVANRGPRIKVVKYGFHDTGEPTLADPSSKTFLIHGGRGTWEGNIAYNDGHVNFETSLIERGSNTPALRTFAAADGRQLGDCLFFDEPQDATASNAYLGIFTKAGAAPADFFPIFD